MLGTYLCMNVLFKPKRGRYGIMRGKHMCIVTTKAASKPCPSTVSPNTHNTQRIWRSESFSCCRLECWLIYFCECVSVFEV